MAKPERLGSNYIKARNPQNTAGGAKPPTEILQVYAGERRKPLRGSFRGAEAQRQPLRVSSAVGGCGQVR